MKARVLTALALIPLVLGAVWISSPWPFFILALIVAMIGGTEVGRLTRGSEVLCGVLSGVAVGLAFYFWYFLRNTDSRLPLYIVGVWVVGVLAAFCSAKVSKIAPLATGWLIAPLVALIVLHEASLPGKPIVLLAFLPIWAGDTAGIFVGKAFGKHKLAPKISPNKTVEGAIGNLLACVLVAIPLCLWLDGTWLQGLGIGLICGVLGQCGDLFESSLKRRIDLKDSGMLLPGHGGILDRIDSILWTAPFIPLVLLWAPG